MNIGDDDADADDGFSHGFSHENIRKPSAWVPVLASTSASWLQGLCPDSVVPRGMARCFRMHRGPLSVIYL